MTKHSLSLQHLQLVQHTMVDLMQVTELVAIAYTENEINRIMWSSVFVYISSIFLCLITYNMWLGLGRQFLFTQNTLVRIMVSISFFVAMYYPNFVSFIEFLMEFCIYDYILDTIHITGKKLLHFKCSKSGQILHVDTTGFPRPSHIWLCMITYSLHTRPIRSNFIRDIGRWEVHKLYWLYHIIAITIGYTTTITMVRANL